MKQTNRQTNFSRTVSSNCQLSSDNTPKIWVSNVWILDKTYSLFFINRITYLLYVITWAEYQDSTLQNCWVKIVGTKLESQARAQGLKRAGGETEKVCICFATLLNIVVHTIYFFLSIACAARNFFKKAVKSTIFELQQSFLYIFGVAQNFWLNGGGFMAQKGGVGDRPPSHPPPSPWSRPWKHMQNFRPLFVKEQN